MCFTGNCLLTLANGKLIKVSDAIPGLKVKTSFGEAKIRCVIKTRVGENYLMTALHTRRGLMEITPYHPIRSDDGEWIFAHTIGETRNIPVESLYNFVLDSHHTVFIHDIECITLGHLYNHATLEHNYFGTEAIINDLKKCPGSDEGMIELNKDFFTRDEKSGRINGMKFIS